MTNKFQQQIQVISRDDLRQNATLMEAAFFDSNGDPIDLGAPAAPPAHASTTVYGTVKQAAHQANSVATDAAGAVVDLNALLAKLQTAGLMA